MHTLYHPDLYAHGPVDSYWETTVQPTPPALHAPLQGEQSFEVAIIGGGYTGLSAALHLARDHHINVCVLDAGHMGWGASGRNGGFGCFPATKLGLQAMISRYGLDETKLFYRAQLEGLDLVKELCRSEHIDCDIVGDGNLEVAHKPSRLDELREYAAALTKHFGVPTRAFNATEFAAIGYQSTEQYGGIHAAAGFALHPLKFNLGLANAAQRHGVSLFSHSTVNGWRREGGVHVLITPQGRVKADRVVMATNGFTREGLHRAFDQRLLPAISNVITTRPLTRDELAAHGWTTFNPICNTRTLLFYFRLLPDNSFLFGARGDTTGSQEDGVKMKSWMARRLYEVFPNWGHVPVSHYWRGLLCMTRKRTPSVGRLDDDPTVYYGFGYHANGVNTAPWAGRQIAEMIVANDDGSRRIPAVCRGMAPKFPLAGLRLWYLCFAYQYYKLMDAMN